MSKSQQQKEFELATLAFAQYLGIDIDNEPDLISIAKEALTDIPSPWEVCISNENEENIFIPFFYNNQTQESIWNHPYENIYINKIKEERKYLKNNPKTEKKLQKEVVVNKKDKFQLHDEDEDEGDNHAYPDDKNQRNRHERELRNNDNIRGTNRGYDRENVNEKTNKVNEVVEIEEFAIESDDDDHRRRNDNQDNRRGSNKEVNNVRKDKKEEQPALTARGSRPTSPIFGDDWLETKKSSADRGNEERSRSQERGVNSWDSPKDRERDDDKQKNDWGRQRTNRDDRDDDFPRNKDRGNDGGRGRSQEREKGRTDWRDEPEREKTSWEREKEREREQYREKDKERDQWEREKKEKEQRDARDQWERERDKRDNRDRGNWSSHPTIDTNVPAHYSQYAPMTEPVAMHQQHLSPPLSLPLYASANSPFPVPGIAIERESANSAMSRLQAEITRLQDEQLRERERHKGEIREMELVISSLKTSLQIAEESLQTERNLKKKSDDMVRELRKEMEGSRDERETSLKSTLEENKRIELDKITQKMAQETADKVREVTLSLTAEIDREREMSRELRIRLIAEEDKVREVKREVAIVREEMELRAKQQLEAQFNEKNELADKYRIQSIELQRVKEELTSMANRAAAALQQAQLAKAEADAARAESTSIISDGQTSHAALMQSLQRITTYETEIIRLKAEKAALQQDLDTLSVEMRRWQDNSARGESRVQGTDAEYKRFKAQAQSEAARLKSRIGELEASNTILNDQYHAILTQLTSQQQEYERKIDRNEHEIHRYEERIEENENRLNEILKINHTSEREILNLQDKLYKKDRLIKELENKLQEMKYQQESSHQEYERNSKKYEEEIENEKEKYLKLENQSKLEINELKKEVERKIPELIQQIHCELESSYYEKLQSELHEKEMKYQHSREELLQEYLHKEEKYQNKLNNLQKERYEEKLQYEKYYERCHNYEEKITEMSNIIHEYKEKERYYSYFQQKHLHHPPPPPPPTHGPPPSRGGEPSYRGGIRPSSYDINGNKRIGDGKTMMKSDELTQATYPIPHHHHMNTLTSTANTSTSNIIEEEPYDEGTYYDPSSYSHAHGHHVPIEDGNTSMETKAILSLNQQIAEMRQTLQDNLQQTKEKNKQILQAQQQLQQPQQYSNLTKKSSPSVPPPFPLPQPSLSDTQREKSISFLSPPRTHPSSSSQKNSNNHGVYSPEQLFQSPKHIKYPKHETSSTSTSQYPAESTINQSVFSNHSHEGLYPDYTSSYRNREGMGGVGGGGGGNIQSRNQFHGILPPTSSDSSDYSTATASSRSSHQDITLPTGGYHEGYWKAKYAKLHVR